MAGTAAHLGTAADLHHSAHNRAVDADPRRRHPCVEAGAVVLDRTEQAAVVVGLDEHRHALGLGMLAGVGQRLAHRPAQRLHLLLAKPGQVVWDQHIGRDREGGIEPGRHGAQRRTEVVGAVAGDRVAEQIATQLTILLAGQTNQAGVG